jgi:hypothetical protein
VPDTTRPNSTKLNTPTRARVAGRILRNSTRQRGRARSDFAPNRTLRRAHTEADFGHNRTPNARVWDQEPVGAWPDPMEPQTGQNRALLRARESQDLMGGPDHTDESGE